MLPSRAGLALAPVLAASPQSPHAQCQPTRHACGARPQVGLDDGKPVPIYRSEVEECIVKRDKDGAPPTTRDPSQFAVSSPRAPLTGACALATWPAQACATG